MPDVNHHTSRLTLARHRAARVHGAAQEPVYVFQSLTCNPNSTTRSEGML